MNLQRQKSLRCMCSTLSFTAAIVSMRLCSRSTGVNRLPVSIMSLKNTSNRSEWTQISQTNGWLLVSLPTPAVPVTTFVED